MRSSIAQGPRKFSLGFYQDMGDVIQDAAMQAVDEQNAATPQPMDATSIQFALTQMQQVQQGQAPTGVATAQFSSASGGTSSDDSSKAFDFAASAFGSLVNASAKVAPGLVGALAPKKYAAIFGAPQSRPVPTPVAAGIGIGTVVVLGGLGYLLLGSGGKSSSGTKKNPKKKSKKHKSKKHKSGKKKGGKKHKGKKKGKR